MSVPVVVLDARLTAQMSVGMKAYVCELVKRLPRVATDMRFIAALNTDIETHADLGIIRIGEKDSVNASWGEQFVLPKRMNAPRPALGHYLTPYAPRWSPFPYVYTVHDLIHRRFPEYHSWKIPLYYAFLVGPVARAAQRVIVSTKVTVPDLQTFLHVGGDRARAVPLGVADAFRLSDGDRRTLEAQTRERFALSLPFFLYAGNHRRHKNLETLAAGWQRVEDACDLVITEDDPFPFDLDRYAKGSGRIVRLGHVDVSSLIGLYAACAGSVQPSLYEGFGLAVLEAMAAGAPCVVAEAPALLEVAGGAALTFPPRDADALARALTLLLHEPSTVDRLRTAGRGRATAFSWDQTARGTAAVYREVIG